MYKIRTRLGFGQVQKIIRTQPNNAIYYRFTTNKRENLERLMFLLNGNLVTEKKREQFKIWVTRWNLRYHSTIRVKVCLINVSLSTAWLSGFIEGDGGFWVSQL